MHTEPFLYTNVKFPSLCHLSRLKPWMNKLLQLLPPFKYHLSSRSRSSCLSPTAHLIRIHPSIHPDPCAYAHRSPPQTPALVAVRPRPRPLRGSRSSAAPPRPRAAPVSPPRPLRSAPGAKAPIPADVGGTRHANEAPPGPVSLLVFGFATTFLLLVS